MGWVDKVILQVTIAVFSGAVEKFFVQRWLTPPRKKLARTPMNSVLPRCHFSASLLCFSHYYSVIVTVINDWLRVMKVYVVVVDQWHWQCGPFLTSCSSIKTSAATSQQCWPTNTWNCSGLFTFFSSGGFKLFSLWELVVFTHSIRTCY